MKTRIAYYCLMLLFLTTVYSCKKEYSYEGGSASAGYLVRDLNDECSSIIVGGSYVIGRNLNDSDFLQVMLHVTKKGAYTIQSNDTNGFSFHASGNFTDTGVVSVRLAAKGKPVNQGLSVFNVQYDSSVCQASVNVLDTLINIVSTTNSELFPLADNNYWSYDDLSYPPDSIVNTINGTTTINFSTYYLIKNFISFFPATNDSYYRRSGNDYFQYEAVSTFTSALDYAPSIYDDLNFLKEGSQTSDSWYSPTYSGRTALGYQVLNLRYLFRCTEADGKATINGKTFLHVWKMQMIPEVGDVGGSLKATGEIHTAYYARGVGLIYSEDYNGIRTHPKLQIKSWKIN